MNVPKEPKVMILCCISVGKVSSLRVSEAMKIVLLAGNTPKPRELGDQSRKLQKIVAKHR